MDKTDKYFIGEIMKQIFSLFSWSKFATYITIKLRFFRASSVLFFEYSLCACKKLPTLISLKIKSVSDDLLYFLKYMKKKEISRKIKLNLSDTIKITEKLHENKLI